MGLLSREKKGSHTSTSPCAHLRAAYHNCFNRWYSEKFVKGQWEKEECVSEWKQYRACLSEHLNDKHLSRFLEAEAVVDPTIQEESGNPADSAASGVPRKFNKLVHNVKVKEETKPKDLYTC